MGHDPGCAFTGEVAGAAVARLVDGVDALPPTVRDAVREGLAAHGVPDESADWYPVSTVADALAAVEEGTGADTLRRLGRHVGTDCAAVDAGAVADALASLDEAYRGRHRGDAGGYAFRRIGDRDGRVECETPYPCPFDKGVVEAVATDHAEGSIRLSEVGSCRDDESRCTYELDW